MILIAPKLLTMLPGEAPFDNAAIVVQNGMIEAVGPAHRIIREYSVHRRHYLKDAALLPGLINLHTHLELPALRILVHANTFPDWAKNLIATIKTLHRNDFRAAAESNISELIRTGTTTVGEICTHGISPALLHEGGLRSIVFHEIISMDQASITGRLISWILMLRILYLLSRNSGIVSHSISPHAVFTVSQPILDRIKHIAAEKNLVLSMHVAESPDEIRLLRREPSGFDALYNAAGWDVAWAPAAQSSFEYLSRIGFLGSGLVAAHAVHANETDIDLMYKTGTSVAHCPRSNAEIGVGRMPLKKMLDAGITVGLGTDSLASSPSLNMWDEMRYAYDIHRNDGVTAHDLFHMATSSGAKALRMDRDIGTLEKGKKADIIAVRLPKHQTNDLISDLLKQTESCMMSMINGKILWSDPGFEMRDTISDE